MATADLGWCFARCSIDTEDSELTVCSPTSSDEPAVTLTIVGLEAILALRDLIDETVSAAEEAARLSQNCPPGD